MIERIREILQVNQLSPTQFADSIGVARPIISHILSGRNKPSLEVVQKIIAAFPAISLPWLLSGAGSMLADVASATTSSTGPTPLSSREAERAPARPPVRKAPKEARSAPQPTAPVSEGRLQVIGSTAGLFEPYKAAPVVQPLPVSPLPADLPVSPQSGPATESVSVPPAVVAPTQVSVPVMKPSAPPAAPADAALASAFAEPGKTIRRIVIFYQDGTFTDYQPEPKA